MEGIDIFQKNRSKMSIRGTWQARIKFTNAKGAVTERLVHPLPLPVHEWRITGLDVNRGYSPSDVLGPEFTGAAARPAALT